MRDGKPVGDVRLVFQPTGGGRSSSAQTDADGRFRLQYTNDEPGTLPGEHVVSVSYTPSDPEEFGKSGNPGYEPAEPYKSIIAKYGDPASSELKVKFEESTADFELKLD